MVTPAQAAELIEVEYGPKERYRIYRHGHGLDEGRIVLVATAATPEAVGTALCTIGAEHMESEGEGHPPVGILDGHERKWLVSLWAR